MKRTTLCLALGWLAMGVAAASNWPDFRGPRGDGIGTAGPLPLEWSEQTNVTWKMQIPGEAWSSPVVWGDQVWISNATKDGKKLSLLCIDNMLQLFHFFGILGERRHREEPQTNGSTSQKQKVE